MNILTFIGASQIRQNDEKSIFTETRNFAYLRTPCRGDERLLTNCALRPDTSCYYIPSNRKNGFYYAGVTCQISK